MSGTPPAADTFWVIAEQGPYAGWVRNLTADPDVRVHAALAVLLIGGIINLRRSTWTFGAPPLDLDEERTLDTFIVLCTALLDLRPTDIA